MSSFPMFRVIAFLETNCFHLYRYPTRQKSGLLAVSRVGKLKLILRLLEKLAPRLCEFLTHSVPRQNKHLQLFILVEIKQILLTDLYPLSEAIHFFHILTDVIVQGVCDIQK